MNKLHARYLVLRQTDKHMLNGLLIAAFVGGMLLIGLICANA